MKGIYHYQGMKLHYLSEDENWAVYQMPQHMIRSHKDKYNPFRVYKLGRKFGDRGWVTTHQLVERYGDLYSCVCHIRQCQGYM